MVARYGAANGFGWRMGDVVGLQLVRVSTAPAEAKAFNSVVVTIGSITSVFVLAAAVMLLLLRRHVTSPLEALTRVALATSLDKPLDKAQEDLPLPTGHGQFEELQRAIQRLKASMDHALRLIERRPALSPVPMPATGSPPVPVAESTPTVPPDASCAPAAGPRS